MRRVILQSNTRLGSFGKGIASITLGYLIDECFDILDTLSFPSHLSFCFCGHITIPYPTLCAAIAVPHLVRSCSATSASRHRLSTVFSFSSIQTSKTLWPVSAEHLMGRLAAKLILTMLTNVNTQHCKPAIMALKRERGSSYSDQLPGQLKRTRATNIPASGSVDPRLRRFLDGPPNWSDLLSSWNRNSHQDQVAITEGGPPTLLEPIDLELYKYGENLPELTFNNGNNEPCIFFRAYAS